MSPGVAAAVPSGSSFSCRASAARIALTPALPVPVIEPFVANGKDTPCATDTANVLTPTTIGPLAANVINVNTSQTPSTLGSAPLVNGDNATASATVTNPTSPTPTPLVSPSIPSASTLITACQFSQSRFAISSVIGEPSVRPPRTAVEKALAEIWSGTLAVEEIGVEVDVKAVPPSQLVQNYLIGRNYQMALVSFDVGSDPDQYSLWHSGADPATLNFAYSRGWGLIDSDLENGREAIDPQARLAALGTPGQTARRAAVPRAANWRASCWRSRWCWREPS